MHARVTQSKVQPDNVDEFISLFQGAVEAARQQPGFIRALLVGDRSTGRSISIALWKSDEQASIESGFYSEQLAKVASVIEGEPERESLDVLFES